MREGLIQILELATDAKDETVLAEVKKLKAQSVQAAQQARREKLIADKVNESCGALSRAQACEIVARNENLG